MELHAARTPSISHLCTVARFATHVQSRVMMRLFHSTLNLTEESTQSDDEDEDGDEVVVDATGLAEGKTVGDAVGDGVDVPSTTQSDGNENVEESSTDVSSSDPV